MPGSFLKAKSILPALLTSCYFYSSTKEIFDSVFRQYKDVIGEEEKYNLKDVIHRQNIYADIDEIDILKVVFLADFVFEADVHCYITMPLQFQGVARRGL